MSRLILGVRLAARALRYRLLPPDVRQAWPGLLTPAVSVPVPVPDSRRLHATPPPPPGLACAACRRQAGDGLCPACTALASWTATAAGAYPTNPLCTWDGLYRPGRYANYQSQCDDSGLITAIRDVVGPSTTRYVNDLFDPLIEQVRGQFAALAFRYRTEAA